MTHPPSASLQHDQLAAVTRLVVGAFTRATGRGPSRASSHLAGDAIVVVLHDALTKQERRLLDERGGEAVATFRSAIYSTTRDELIAGVATICEREIVSLHIDHQLREDVIAVVATFAQSPAAAGASSPGDAVGAAAQDGAVGAPAGDGAPETMGGT